jgi:hypothetical protein
MIASLQSFSQINECFPNLYKSRVQKANFLLQYENWIKKYLPNNWFWGDLNQIQHTK